MGVGAQALYAVESAAAPHRTGPVEVSIGPGSSTIDVV
jgi:hypothetical protein